MSSEENITFEEKFPELKDGYYTCRSPANLSDCITVEGVSKYCLSKSLVIKQIKEQFKEYLPFCTCEDCEWIRTKLNEMKNELLERLKEK